MPFSTPRRLCASFLSLLALCATSTPLPSQEKSPQNSGGFLEIWGGLAQGSPQWGILGETPDMNLAIFALRFSQDLGGPPDPNASRRTTWHIDLIPLARLSPPYISLAGLDRPCNPGALCVASPERGPGLFPHGSATGIGVAPLGITMHFRQNRRVSPSIGATGGALIFNKAVPTTLGGILNFTAALEAGLRVGPPDGSGLVLSYRLHHISNAGSATENPGVMSHLFTVGVRGTR